MKYLLCLFSTCIINVAFTNYNLYLPLYSFGNSELNSFQVLKTLKLALVNLY